MDNEEAPPSVNFIPCVKWVKKGVAKEIPEKVQLTKEELQDIINQTKSELSSVKEEEEEIEQENEGGDEYHFDQYDDEDVEQDALLGIGNLAVYSSNSGDPYITIGDDEDDSEKEDDVITPKDNLILVGHVEGDASILEIYVYNEEEESLYVHHDLLLPSVPLCLEWLNYDPGEGKPGNLCAVGNMSSIIEVWDIDIVDCLEPAFKLGRRGSKKKGITKYGHRDAVLDLSWNKNVNHVLASGSADQTVLLWDLDTGKYASKLKSFEEKVQTLQWHPFEGQTLLVGSCDRIARVFDCRIEDAHMDWEVNGEVERVLWNHFSPYNFIVGTSTGSIHYIDCRNKKPLWELSAHAKEVTGVALSSQCPGMLLTAGGDGCLKTWDIVEGTPSLVYSHDQTNLGSLLCLDACPDLPFVVTIGGDNKSHNFTVVNVLNSTAVQHRFGERDLVHPVKTERGQQSEAAGESAMETADAMFESLSLETQEEPSTSKSVVKSFQSGGMKKKKKLKKKK